jgi:hypothetical protein
MAKPIVIRRIEYLPANPGAKCCTLDIDKILEFETVSGHAADPHHGHTRILLKEGGYRYSSESVKVLKRAYIEALKG